MKLLHFFLIIGFVCLFMPQSMAQETDGLGGYVPPPLFAPRQEPTEIERKSHRSVPHLPVISPDVDSSETPNDGHQPLIKGRVVPEAPDEMKVEVPVVKVPQKVVSPVIEKPAQTKAPVPKAKPIAAKKIEKPQPSYKEPIDLLEEKQKKTQQGVVKGPKTMPAHKKKAVESAVTYEAEKAPPLLNRIQPEKTVEKSDQERTDQKAAPFAIELPAPQYEEQPDRSLKYTMLYQPVIEGLSPEQIARLDQHIIPRLDEFGKARLLIQSYASPLEGVLGGDRRIALSRALAIREYLLTQQVDSERIDVRSLGDSGNVQPRDRVEFFIIY